MSKSYSSVNSKTVKQFSSLPHTSKYLVLKDKKKIFSQPQSSVTAGSSTSVSTKTNLQSDPSNLIKKLPNGYKYGLFLPNIYDANLCPVNQPFLAQICEFELLEFGFDIPFNDFFNEKNNSFSIEIGSHKLSARIISIADSPSNLQECLRNNLELNPDWKNLRKIIGNINKVIHLVHSPLLEPDDFPIKHIFSDKLLDNLIKEFTSNEENRSNKIISKMQRSSSTKEKSQVKETVEESRQQQNTGDRNQIQENQTELSDNDTSMEMLKMKLDALNQKKSFLIDSDILSSTLKATIEAVSSVFSLIVKEKETNIVIMHVSAKDETFKIKKKNQIFVEGLIQFDLDKYQFATTKAKQKNPCALAYQLVHRVFPTVYWKNVTLGKKFYDEDEIESFSKQLKETSKNTKKVPLCFVWGFKDPYNEPYQGDLDIIRGQERVRALIDHIFRKCGKLTYVEEEEAKVRERLIKELCQKNSPEKFEKRKSLKSTDFSEFSDERDQSDNDNGDNFENKRDDKSIHEEYEDDDTQSALSDIWNNDLFSRNKN